MSRVQDLERQVAELTSEELTVFQRWFADFVGEHWDRQFEEDVSAGRLDKLAERALSAHAAGQTTKF